MIDGLEFVELDEADWCCGLAGTQLITHYETSLKVLKRKTDNLAATRAGYVASGCPACQMQLNVGVRRAGLEMQVVHPIELLDRAYRSRNVSHPIPETTKVVTTNNKVVTTNKKEK
jgi:glycolate oxidase iron-sulfur subunit